MTDTISLILILAAACVVTAFTAAWVYCDRTKAHSVPPAAVQRTRDAWGDDYTGPDRLTDDEFDEYITDLRRRQSWRES